MLPFFPKALVHKIARFYIAGDSAQDAVDLAYKLKKNGFLATIDMLGENIIHKGDANLAVTGYRKLMNLMLHSGIERNISIKLSQLGIRIDKDSAWRNLLKVLEKAVSHNFFVRIDMEDSTITDDTLELYTRAHKIWPRVGTVLQARLKRTRSDARMLAAKNTNFRLCKGIYPEYSDIAFTDFNEIRQSYLHVLEILLDRGSFVALATHDLPMLEAAEAIIENKTYDNACYEYQALLGVPFMHELGQRRDQGKKVRLYLPYGQDWYAYGIRRLKENPQMAKAIAKGLFKNRKYERALFSTR